MPSYTTFAPLPKLSLQPRSYPPAFTHLDEEKTLNHLIYGYVVGVPFLFLNSCCLLCLLRYRPIHNIAIFARSSATLPVTSTGLKRFVSIIGPVCRLQGRVEDKLWKTGLIGTLIWMAVYSFVCVCVLFRSLSVFLADRYQVSSPASFFSCLIALATYPYPSKIVEDPISATQSFPSLNATERSVPWQANIQGVQELMGAT